ncbi:MAG: hypothetical protein K9L85_02460 [Candidatus Peribacteraceae bacterium]|nr:hypothetical protein [Candidatus Peribacteraceae bacterium]
MAKFYFTAVSNSAKKKLSGSIAAETEKDAREQLNKIGMAILSMGTEQPDDWQGAFEFSVADKADHEFTGEILSENPEAVFERLANEFELRKINWICRADASEEEKLQARQNSLKEIIAKKKLEEQQKTELEKRTISGSLKSLVNMGEEKKPSKWEENLKKFSNESEEDLSKKSAADVADPDKPDADKIKKVQLQDSQSKSEDSAAGEDSEKAAELKEDEPSWRDQLGKLKDKLLHFSPALANKFGEFYFHATEIIVPPEGKTRADGWRTMRKFLFPPRDQAEVAKAASEKVLHRKLVLERFWVAFEEIVDLLAAVFIAYFALGMTALYVEIPRISELAEQTLRGNFMVHFLVGTFIFIRVLILLRKKFTSWSFLRTSLLFLSGTVVIVFAGINLL